ncbi:DUF998 domain-containing protein [Streptomyces piniterrae]|uniref:DUF998 domain-containing protein n=2 Tax=Streptomyces piniterrae TaxID=2571125 RepID=A0A4U0NK04_9ACTN|nr:DUF998 domain-containing protein [Streptomyces piniterrae]
MSRRGDPTRAGYLLACGVIAGPLFVVTCIVAGATRADYDPLRHPVSSLALGDLGWIQVVNFIVTGALGLAFAFGLGPALRPLGGSPSGALLVGAWATGLLGAGIFVTDPVSGYPSGTPERLAHYGSTHAALHDGLSLIAFLALAVACFVFARRFVGWGKRAWAIYSALTGIAFVATFALSSLGFDQTEGLVGMAGLFQLAAITVGWCWLSLLALHLLQRDVRQHRAEAQGQ